MCWGRSCCDVSRDTTKGWSLKESLHAGNVSVSLVATVRGDYENTPDLEILKFYLGSEHGEKRHLR